MWRTEDNHNEPVLASHMHKQDSPACPGASSPSRTPALEAGATRYGATMTDLPARVENPAFWTRKERSISRQRRAGSLGQIVSQWRLSRPTRLPMNLDKRRATCTSRRCAEATLQGALHSWAFLRFGAQGTWESPIGHLRATGANLHTFKCFLFSARGQDLTSCPGVGWGGGGVETLPSLHMY